MNREDKRKLKREQRQRNPDLVNIMQKKAASLQEHRQMPFLEICRNLNKDYRISDLREMAVDAHVVQPEKLTKRELCAQLAILNDTSLAMRQLFPNGVIHKNVYDLFDCVMEFGTGPTLSIYIEWNSKLKMNRAVYFSGGKSAMEYITIALEKQHSDKDVMIFPLWITYDSFPILDDEKDTFESAKKYEWVYDHQNVLIVDIKQKIAYRYEPLFRRNDRAMLLVDELLSDLFLTKDQLQFHPHPNQNGVQQVYKGELCVLYCAVFAHQFEKTLYEKLNLTKMWKIDEAFHETYDQMLQWTRDNSYFEHLKIILDSCLDLV